MSFVSYAPMSPVENNKRIVLALQNGLKSELTRALKCSYIALFKEEDEAREMM